VNTAGALDFCEIQFPRLNGIGNVVGFNVVLWDSSTDDTSTGFIDSNFNPVAEPQIKVGQGFFIHNTSLSPIVWTQVLSVGA